MTLEVLKPAVVIRRVIIPPRGEIFEPDGENRFGGVEKVVAKAPTILESNGFQVRPYQAASPHTPNGEHVVNWIVRSTTTAELQPWTDEDTQALLHNEVFLSALEIELHRQMQVLNDARSYVHFGYVPRELPLYRDGVMHIGLQSQRRIHFHVAEGVADDLADEWLSTEVPKERHEISRNMNFAGEEALSHFWKFFKNFGQEFSLQQPLSHSRAAYIPRTGFGFYSLAEALQSVSNLQAQVQPTWLPFAQRLTQENVMQKFAGETFSLRQSSVPNFIVVLPSEADRQTVVERPAFPVWVFPLSVVGAPELVTPVPLSLDRR